MVMEPTLTSQRPAQLPAVMTAQSWAVISTWTPSRLAISVATSTSKPSHTPLTSADWGGYAASVETTSLPAARTFAGRSSGLGVAAASVGVAVGSAVAVAVGDGVGLGPAWQAAPTT